MRKIILSLALLISLNAQEIYTNFSVEARKSANLAFDSGGIINHIFVDIATVVKKGDKLAELKNDDLKASLVVAKTSLDMEKTSLQIQKVSLEDAKISLKYAKRDYERQLKIKDIIDDARFDNFALVYEKAKVAVQKAEVAIQKTEVAVQKAEANLLYKQTLLDKTVLYAPFDGIIFNKNVEAGDVVSEMSLRTILKIQSIKERNLIVEFDQKHWKVVKVGQSYKYKVDGDTTAYQGVISKLYPFANNGNRKITAEVRAKGFVVGLFGEGYISIPAKK